MRPWDPLDGVSSMKQVWSNKRGTPLGFSACLCQRFCGLGSFSLPVAKHVSHQAFYASFVCTPGGGRECRCWGSYQFYSRRILPPATECGQIACVACGQEARRLAGGNSRLGAIQQLNFRTVKVRCRSYENDKFVDAAQSSQTIARS